MKRSTRDALALTGLAVGLTYVSHVAAMVFVVWKTTRRYRGSGMAGERFSDHLPVYAYPRRRIGPSLVVLKDLDSGGVEAVAAIRPDGAITGEKLGGCVG